MGGPDTAMPRPALIADIGGTNVRFALVAGGAPEALRVLHTADYPHIAAAVRAYLDQAAPATAPAAAAFAVASPVAGDDVRMTNRDWSFSIDRLRQDLGLETLHVINDFAAIALAVPHLGAEDVARIGGGAAAEGAPIAVIGPGTGLGVSLLVRTPGCWTPVATEGGHVTLAAADDREAEVIAHLRRRFGHVSAERALSGPGLVNLHAALAAIAGQAEQAAAVAEPTDITARALAGSDPLCRDAVAMFCAMLGTVAGDLALSLGAQGGVYIAGGIVPDLGALFAATDFRARFEAKGRFKGYMAAIPTFVITMAQPAFTGLAALLEEAG